MGAYRGRDRWPEHDAGWKSAAASATCVHLEAGALLSSDDGVYFLIDAVTTLILQRDQSRFQVGFAARGDVIGIQKLFVPEFPSVCARVLRAGNLIRVRPQALRRLLRRDGQLRDRLCAYAMRSTCGYLDEAARTISQPLERRVAHWVARCRETLDSDVIAITHQDLAYSLGVRRSGVTVALHVLEGEQLIRSKRGRIEIVDRDRLAMLA